MDHYEEDGKKVTKAWYIYQRKSTLGICFIKGLWKLCTEIIKALQHGSQPTRGLRVPLGFVLPCPFGNPAGLPLLHGQLLGQAGNVIVEFLPLLFIDAKANRNRSSV